MANQKISKKTKFLNFITFGYLKKKALKSNKIDDLVINNYDINKLLDLFGGKDNLQNYKILSSNSLEIKFNDISLLKIEELKNYIKPIGIMKNNDSITLISKDVKSIFEILKNA